MKFNFNPIKNLVTGAAIFAASHANAAEKPAEKITSPEPVKTEVGSAQQEVAVDASSEAVNFADAREMEIKKLDQKMHRLEDAIFKKTNELHLIQASLQHTYEKATEYSGIHSKHRLHGLEYELSELAMQMGKKEIVSHEITSEAAVNEILGILLSLDGPLKKYTEQIVSISGNQLGSTVMMNTGIPGKYESEDMSIHRHLGTDPKEIVKKSLEIVDIQNQLEQAQEELNVLLGQASEMVAKK